MNKNFEHFTFFRIDLYSTQLYNAKESTCSLLFKLFSGNSWCRSGWNYSTIDCLYIVFYISFLYQIYILFKAHQINVVEELRQKPQATGLVCPVEGCRNAPSATCENRFCEYDILIDLYLFKFYLKLEHATNNFYVYSYGVIK